MARKSPQEAAAKWVNRVQQSGQYYQQGVANPNVDWAGNAIAASDRRDQGLVRAMQEDRINRGIQAVGTDKWRKNTLAKGVTAWTTNTPKAQPQYLAGINRTYGYYAQADQAVANMPRDTRQQRIARAAAFLDSVGSQSDAFKAGRG